MKNRQRSISLATAALSALALATVGVSAQAPRRSAAAMLSVNLASASRVAQMGSGTGYWVASADGEVYAFGTAQLYGSLKGDHLNAPITGILATTDGRGYWLVAKDGAVFSFGDALFNGSLGGKVLGAPVVGIASSNPEVETPGPRGARGLTGLRGATGSSGALGSTGGIGLTGPAGGVGPTGTAGSNGLAGPAGGVGPTGTAGSNGLAGPAGSIGLTGPAGGIGLTGPAGGTGLTGPAGPAATPNYAYIYNVAAQTVPIEGSVAFDNNGPVAGFAHVPGTSTMSVTVAGTYVVSFSTSATEVSQFAVAVDGVVVPQTTYGSGAGTQQNNGQAILQLGAGDIITLRNHSSAAAVGLPSAMGGTQANVNASLLVEQLR